MLKVRNRKNTFQRLLESVELTKAAVGRRMEVTRKRNKKNYDKKGLWEPQIRVADEVYIKHP